MHLINKILSELSPLMANTKLNVLSQVCKSILISSGKITMLEIKRHTDLSYRTIQRFFSQHINWLELNLSLFRNFVYNQSDVFLLALDETVHKKSGKKTYGLDYFFSNLFKQAIPSVAFMGVSLVSTSNAKSYPIDAKQVVKPVLTEEQKIEKKSKNKDKKKNKTKVANPNTEKNVEKKQSKKGRPKGSKNNPKEASQDVQYQVVDQLLKSVIAALTALLFLVPCTYLVLDGYFGNQYYMRLAKSYKLQLISKLKKTACLHLPSKEPYSGKGRRKKYGEKLNFAKLDDSFLVQIYQEDGVKYRLYNTRVWSKSYTDAMLNVLIIVAQDIQTQKTGHVVLFSTDLDLPYDKLLQYYKLRFQIEFNFRDAKQYFGLADFKNYKQTQVENAVGLSFFMCTFSYILIAHFKELFKLKKTSILDIKTFFRIQHTANKTVELNNQKQKPVNYLTDQQILELAKYELINS